MSDARAVGWAYGVAVALIVTLAGPLLLFNPWFVSFEQQRHHSAALLAADEGAIDRVTGTILGDLFTGGQFAVSLDGQTPLLDAMERSHMRDVGGLVRILAVVLAAALLVFALAGSRLRDRRRRRRLLLVASASVGAAALVLAGVFAVAFEPAFLAFHRLFFSEGTYLFGPDSNLIKLFPEGFWFESSLAAGATIVLAAVLVGLRGWRLRSASRA